jgi:hypothetical protein
MQMLELSENHITIRVTGAAYRVLYIPLFYKFSTSLKNTRCRSRSSNGLSTGVM